MSRRGAAAQVWSFEAMMTALVKLMVVLLLSSQRSASAHAEALSPPCSVWWVTEQNTFSKFDLKHLGLGVGAVSINDDYFAAGGECAPAWQCKLLLTCMLCTSSHLAHLQQHSDPLD
jgi:hypothetical protein